MSIKIVVFLLIFLLICVVILRFNTDTSIHNNHLNIYNLNNTIKNEYLNQNTHQNLSFKSPINRYPIYQNNPFNTANLLNTSNPVTTTNLLNTSNPVTTTNLLNTSNRVKTTNISSPSNTANAVNTVSNNKKTMIGSNYKTGQHMKKVRNTNKNRTLSKFIPFPIKPFHFTLESKC